MASAAIVIGIANTEHLTPLQGAVPGAHDFAQWAGGQGMDVTLITDEGGRKVRLSDLIDAVDPIVEARTYEKLVVFFAGHGFLLAPQTEVWLLPEGLERSSEAVNVSLSRNGARYCGIPHVIFVSDACRSGGPSHRHRQVLGGSMFPVLVNDAATAEIDTFYACRPGDPALEFKDDVEAATNHKGIFTECMLRALGGLEPEVLEQDAAAGVPYVVRSFRLRDHLRRTVPARAEAISIKLAQAPEVRAESHPPKYFAAVRSVPAGMTIPTGGPPAAPDDSDGLDVAAYSAALRDLTPEPYIEQPADLAAPRGEAQERFRSQIDVLEQQLGRPAFETETGFTVHAAVRSVTLGGGIGHDLFHEDVGGQDVQHVRVHCGYDAVASALVEFEDGTGTVVAIKPGFVGAIQAEGQRVVNVNYTPAVGTPLWIDEEIGNRMPAELRRRAYVAAATRNGVFDPQEDPGYAGRFLRMLKRVDPTLGVYAAYAYHEAGNLKSVRSVLAYMRDDPPPVPYDVALLAQIERAQWPATAPFGPMLTQGWALLALGGDAAANLAPLRQHLLPALWNTLDEDGVRWVRERLESGELQ